MHGTPGTCGVGAAHANVGHDQNHTLFVEWKSTPLMREKPHTVAGLEKVYGHTDALSIVQKIML